MEMPVTEEEVKNEELEEDVELETTPSDESTPDQQEIEKRARRMGWVPKEEFRGDPDRHIPAEKFLERGEQELPILRERYRTLEDKLDRMEKTFSEFSEYHKKTVESAYDKAAKEYETQIKQLKRRLKQAASEGDIDTYDNLETELETLEQNRPEKPELPQGQQTQPYDDPVIKSWINDNQWFNRDMEMQAYAISMENYLSSTKGLTGKPLYDEITKEVRVRFPDRFENPNRNQPSDVSGGEPPTPPSKPKGKTFKDLPEDAKKACREYEKQGLLTREQYLKDYDWEA